MWNLPCIIAFGFDTNTKFCNQTCPSPHIAYGPLIDCMTETTICSANTSGPDIVRSVYVNHFIHSL